MRIQLKSNNRERERERGGGGERERHTLCCVSMSHLNGIDLKEKCRMWHITRHVQMLEFLKRACRVAQRGCYCVAYNEYLMNKF